ncbi:MAG: efflux RND transporter periplasmic adaptor subunit [Chitinophagales bacterium]
MDHLIINIKNWFRFSLVLLVFAGWACNTGHEKETAKVQAEARTYRCPMHNEIVRDKPGNCPICGMNLVLVGAEEKSVTDIGLNTELRPAKNDVLSTIPVVSIQASEEETRVEALGTIQYDAHEMAGIAARISGRIEKIYLKYTFQDISKGQKIMDIYSPDLITAQQDLLFVIKNDPMNSSLINAAKEKLHLLGMSDQQLQEVIRSQKPSLTVSLYSNYNGHIHDAFNDKMNASSPGSRSSPGNAETVTTRALLLKEGMYIQKGQTILSVLNPHKLYVLLNIYSQDQGLVKVGDAVQILPETAPESPFTGKINFIEPFFREGNRTLTARVYFENHQMNIPVGSQVKATIHGVKVKGNWLPKDAIISLGIDKVVFKKQGGVFRAHKVITGQSLNNRIQIIDGLTPDVMVASNAQFLVDSESFIKINE